MSEQKTETTNLIERLQSLPDDHILHSLCSYYSRFTAPATQIVKLSEVLIAIDGTTYRETKDYTFSSGMHDVWIGLFVQPEYIKKKLYDHKRKNPNYTAENEKNTINLMKKKNCGSVSTFTHIPKGAARHVENIESITGVYSVDFDDIPSERFESVRAAL
jgi:hypothetical protein